MRVKDRSGRISTLPKQMGRAELMNLISQIPTLSGLTQTQIADAAGMRQSHVSAACNVPGGRYDATRMALFTWWWQHPIEQVVTMRRRNGEELTEESCRFEILAEGS